MMLTNKLNNICEQDLNSFYWNKDKSYIQIVHQLKSALQY